jgi:membrane protein YdbS with pleckstrin-like domain
MTPTTAGRPRDASLVSRDAAGSGGSGRERIVRIVSILLVVWLLIGAAAAAQRKYFSGSDTNCAKVGTIAVTVVAGPLNYLGANPKIRCQVPQPST